ncbi:MAG TPA: oligosaccharide flippase family protein, partial [Candidatus Manganitrophaceae bacterium]
MRSTSISKQAITLISGRGLASLFTFLIPVVLTRHLTPADYGTFKQVFLIYGTLFTVLPFGTIQSLYYFIPKDPDRIKVYLVQSLLFLQVSGLIAMLFLLTLGQKISVYFNNPALAPYLFQLGLFIFLTLSSAYFEALLISSQKINQAAILSFISEACKTGFMLVPLLFWRDLSSLMWGMGLFAFFRFSLTMVYVVRRYSLSWKYFDRPSFRTQLAYALPFGLAVILQVTQDHFHQYVVAYTYSAAVFAVYSVGMFQLPLIELVGAPMSQLLIVRMTSLLRQGGAADEVLALWRDITKKLAIVFIPAFVFLQVMAREVVVFLFTSAYLPSVPLIRLSAVSLLTAFLLAEGALRAYAQTRFILKVTFIKT